MLSREPRTHLMWFIHEHLSVELSQVKEIFIDATYNTSKMPNHLYAVVSQELGYGVPLAFMLMEIHPKEDTKAKKHTLEASECNRNFYRILEELGVVPVFVHTDKDFSEISAAQVTSLISMDFRSSHSLLECEKDGIVEAIR